MTSQVSPHIDFGWGPASLLGGKVVTFDASEELEAFVASNPGSSGYHSRDGLNASADNVDSLTVRVWLAYTPAVKHTGDAPVADPQPKQFLRLGDHTTTPFNIGMTQ